jgi:uncharacterized protein (TIGR02284 family)
MATLVGKQSNPVSLLRALIELDWDAIEAYEAAIEKLKNATFRQQMNQFCDDHRRHVSDLNLILQRLGGEPVLKADIKRVLTKGKVYLASLFSDRAILGAMKTNEEDTNTAYERAVAHEGFDAEALAVLNRNLSDERRHRAWIIQTLTTTDFAERTSSPSIS